MRTDVRYHVRMSRRSAPSAPPAVSRARKPTNLSLPPDLVAEVDALAGPRGRSAFVEEAVRRAIRRERLRVAIESTAGAWAGKGPAMWDEPDGVVRWVRELRVEETDPGPER
jgi:hypothetical protein